MKNIIILVCLIICSNSYAQNKSNRGKDFWVGYPAINTNVSQDMTLYISCDSLPTGMTYATVTVTIDNSSFSINNWWKRLYHIPANTVINIAKTTAFSYSPASTLAIGALPQSTCQLSSDACPFGNGGTGIFTGKGIHISSDVDITAFGNIYGSVSSAAYMLLPTTSLGYDYTIINSAQNNTAGSANFFYIIANEDSTRIKITASNLSNAIVSCQSAPPSPFTSYIVELQKGQIYQYTGYTNSGNDIGVELTGSKVQSIPNANGITKKIGVFAGSSRTGGESSAPCFASSRDNDMQQCYPENTWGKKYALTPFAISNVGISTSSFSQTVYKIIAKDTGTYVAIGGLGQIALSTTGAYKFSASTPKFVRSNKPIMIAQFMTSGNCSAGDGDPEMIYLNPIEQAVNGATFYRSTVESINTNFINIVIPDSGINTLKIDGNTQSNNWGGNVTVKSHPEMFGYMIVIKGWAAANQQCLISSNAKFNAFSYGLGSVESYGFSCGAGFDSIYSKLVLKGVLKSPLNKGIVNGNVSILGTTNEYSLSDATGAYSLNANEGNYTLRSTKNNDVIKANGVTSIDALLTQRHILNTTKLNSPYKIIAADVDGNKAINSVDVLRIKRLILGNDTTFTKTVGITKTDRLWEFIDSAYVFPDTTNPFPFKDSISFTNLTSSKINQTFIGVKLGDVNYDWNPAVARPSTVGSRQLTGLELIYNVISTKEKSNQIDFSGTNVLNKELQIQITSTNFNNISTMQYTLHFDNTKYAFVGIENNKLGIDFNASEANATGNIAMLWIDKNAEAKNYNKDKVLFTIILKPLIIDNRQLTDLQLTNDIAEVEAWDNNFIKHSITLAQRMKTQELATKNELTVYPNPAKNLVNIDCKNAKQILILNAFGIVARKICNVGKHQVITTKQLAKGIYVIQVMMQDGSIKNSKLIVE